MYGLTGYTISEPLHQGSRAILLRGYRDADHKPVVVKLPRSEFPTPRELARLRHEFLITRSLTAPGIIKVYNLEEAGSRLAIIMEDFGAKSLNQVLAAGRFNLQAALRIAILITEAVKATHEGHVIHKDIKPRNILINPTASELKLIDFGIANRLSEGKQEARPPDALEGTIAYMSPEQTGRMARVIDHRSDLYSVGVTLYEMFTGSLPFQVADPMELVHCHIARMPAAPHERAPEIPEMVSAIVMKLLAKAAEDRYQSAYGLMVDLEECLAQLQATGAVAPYPLGRKDRAGVLQIPQRLYGRKNEPVALLDAFERACEGGTELCLVSGEPGVGKSALVDEVYRALGRRRGYFISGKFDQLSRTTPYSAVATAFGNLINQLLMEREDALARWKAAILGAVRGNGKVLTDVIPELELVIGKQPDVPELSAAAALNRFTLVFQDLLAVFATADHPLVLFLDDLQWADLASLRLLEVLMTGPKRGYLLVIGAYRSNEVDAGHPLRKATSNISAAARLSEIKLGVLDGGDVAQLVADAVGSDIHRTQPLASIIFEKTQGNPFFAIQFLTAIHEDRLLTFDAETRSFQWDLEVIRTRMVTDNVVVLVMQRLRKLGPEAQRALSLAACVGHQFDLKILSTLCASPPAQVAGWLWEALEAGVVSPLGTEYQFYSETLRWIPEVDVAYRFVHDRVQQAAYSLIEEGDRAAVHLRIGRLMLANVDRAQGEAMFDVVSHLNVGASLITDRDERIAVARLNLETGKRARAATAYPVAAGYLAAGISLLDETCWEQSYELARDLYLQRAECEAQSGAHAAADGLLATVLERAQTDIERAEVLDLRVVLYTAQMRNDDALAAGTDGLRLLGVPVFDTEQEWMVAARREIDAINLKLAGRRVEDLIDAPMTIERAPRVMARLLRSMSAPAFAYRPQFCFWLSAKAVHLSLVHGNTDISASNYALFGWQLVDIVAQYRLGYEFGKLALALQQKLKNINGLSAIYFTFGGIALFTVSFREVIAIFERACSTGLESGEFVHMSYACSHTTIIRLIMGDPLPMVAEELERSLALVRRFKVASSEALLILSRRMIESLRGNTTGRDELNGDDFDERAALEGLERSGFNYARCWYWTIKASLRFFYEDYRGVIAMLNPIRSATTSTYKMEIRMYLCLAIVAVLPSASEHERGALEADLAACMSELADRTDACPDNCLHKQLLVQAELARISDDWVAAADLYDRAIATAQAHKWPRDIALGSELAAKFYLGRNRPKLARAYMMEAHDCYLHWGATAKASHLVERYPELFHSAAPVSLSEHPRAINVTASTNDGTAGGLDVVAMIQAAQAIAGEIVLDRLLTRLMQVVAESAGAERGSLLLKEDSTGDLVVAANVAPDVAPVILRTRVPLESGERLSLSIVQYVERTQKSVVLHDACREGTFNHDDYVASSKLRSVLCMPVQRQGEVRGVLYLENNLTAGAFTAERVELLRVLCSQIAISIENATLYASLEQKVIERTRELRDAQKRLVKLERELTEGQMAGGFAHEMRNSLSGAKMFMAGAYAAQRESLCAQNSDMLQQLFLAIRDDLPTDRMSTVRKLLTNVNANEQRLDRILSGIDEGLTRALEVTGLILEYSQLSRGQPGHEVVYLRDVATAVLREQDTEIRANGVDTQVSIPPELWLRGSTLHVTVILRNLVRNAVTAITEKTEPGRREVQIVATEEDGRAVLSVSDTGVGIRPEDRDRIFEPFFSTRPSTGTGLGLGMVDKLVSLYQGTITFESNPGLGSTFTVTLPAGH